MTPQDINSLGLILDIVGVTFLFFNGLPIEHVFAPGNHFYFVNPNEEKSISHRIRCYLSKLALALIVIGFVLQLMSNQIKQPASTCTLSSPPTRSNQISPLPLPTPQHP